MVGHVDHGKSTLIGRLLHDTGSLDEAKKQRIKDLSDSRGRSMEWAFLMDGLKMERDQGITVESTQACFTTEKRTYRMIDAPGHITFLRNMVTGASLADAAILLLDVKRGLEEQTRRHAYILSLMGLCRVIVAINKMDTVDEQRAPYDEQVVQCRNYLEGMLGLQVIAYVPISARCGTNIIEKSPQMPWYKGESLLATLENIEPIINTSHDARYIVQDVYKIGEDRAIAGRLSTGRLKYGDNVHLFPSGEQASIEDFIQWDPANNKIVKKHDYKAIVGDCLTLLLDRKDLFIERGTVLFSVSRPLMKSSNVSVRVFWLDQKPLRQGDIVTLCIDTRHISATVTAFDGIFSTETTARRKDATILNNNEAGCIRLSLDEPISIPTGLSGDEGRIVLRVEGSIVAGGLIIKPDAPSTNLYPEKTHTLEMRRSHYERHHQHRGGVLWMTGLSGSGKSTIACLVEEQLQRIGYAVAVIDGDTLRTGLCSDLGFSSQDRAENMRRAAHLSRFLLSYGWLVLVSLISPLRQDRIKAKDLVGDGFREIYVNASLEMCEKRDIKGLYLKARRGEIKDFTGVNAPYEPPRMPDLTIFTQNITKDEAQSTLCHFIREQFSYK